MDETNVVEYDKKFWPYDATLALINIVEARYEELHHPNKRKHVWQNVSTDLESVNIFVTANTCQKKWQNLLRSYKACKENMNKIGRGPMRFKFFQRIDELMGDEPHINKKHEISFINIDTASTSSLELNSQTETDCLELNTQTETDCLERVCAVSNSSEEGEEDPLPSSPLDHPIKGKKRKNFQADYINLKKQYLKSKEAEWKKRREDKNKRENKKLELYERKLNLEERKIRVLEELIKLRKNNK